MQDKYWVEDVIITQDSGYVVSGSFELCDEFYYERWGFLMKTDKDGNMIWASKDSVDFMSDNGDFVDFVETSDGDFLTIGSRIPSGGYMLKRDSEGNRLWAQSYTSFGTKSMSNTADNNIILGGVVNSNIALRKIDNNGNALWTKSYDCGNVAIANSIKETFDGDYILTGIVSGNGYDIIIIKTDSLGDSLWTKTFDGYGEHDEGNCVIETNDGNILVGGVIGAPAPVYGYGFLSYLYPNGDTLWTKNIPANVFSPFLSLYDDIIELTAYGGCHGEAKMIKLNYSGDITYEKLIYGYRPSGDKSFQKIEGGYIFLSRPGSHNNKITLTKTDENGNFLSIDENPTISENLIDVYPNPFCSSINLQYTLPYQIKNCIVKIYNIKGELVNKIFMSKDGLMSGNKTWNGLSIEGKEVQNGIYFLKLESDNYRAVKKVTKIK